MHTYMLHKFIRIMYSVLIEEVRCKPHLILFGNRQKMFDQFGIRWVEGDNAIYSGIDGWRVV